MANETVFSTSRGVVDKIQQTGDTWMVRVANTGGGLVVYGDLSTVNIMHCDVVNPGDIIGSRLKPELTVTLGWQEPIYYPGNGTSAFQSDLLKGAKTVIWSRSGIHKTPGLAADSYTFDPTTGTINSTEAQATYENFIVQYKNI